MGVQGGRWGWAGPGYGCALWHGLSCWWGTVSPGGEGKPGRVVDIRGWDVETGRSVASVTWADGTTNVYRVGHKGKVDLKCVGEAAGGFYYKEHLPRLGKGCPAASCLAEPAWGWAGLGRGLCGGEGPGVWGVLPELGLRLPPGKPAELQRRVSADGQPFQPGDKVTCLLDTDVLREMQEGHGGWNPRMAEVSCPAHQPCALPSPRPWTPSHSLHDPPQFIGQTGTVHRITDRGDVRVQFSHETRWTFHPGALTKVHGGRGEPCPFPVHPSVDLLIPEEEERAWGVQV